MNNISIYVHWPFCLSKCPYCDFNSHVAPVESHQLWLECYLQEIEYFKKVIGGKYIKSIFFGGGTPSLMGPQVVKGVIARLAELGTVDTQTEITLEANPTSFETVKFQQFRDCGISRVSIGVQALKNEDLKKLGREHNKAQAINAIKSASSIFERTSFDLIYARPGQTLKDWQEELIEALEFIPNHISLYQLTIEKGTPFYKLHQDKKLILPRNEEAADMYEWTTSILKNSGFQRYEISNYAKVGQECRHNLTYWNYEEYLGIGPGAHSRLKNYDENKYLHVNNSTTSLMMWHKPEKWLKSVQELGCGIQTIETLTLEETIEEFFMMGLRLKCGVNLKDLKIITDKEVSEFLNEKMLKYYVELKLLNFNKDHIALTDKGLMLHSYLVPRLFVVR